MTDTLDQPAPPEAAPAPGANWMPWIILLAAALAISVILNVIILIARSRS